MSASNTPSNARSQAEKFQNEEKIVFEPMRYRDIPTVFAGTEEAFANDPLERYITDTPDGNKHSLLWKLGRMGIMGLRFVASTFHSRMWTINHGEAIIAIGDPTAIPRRGADIFDTVIMLITRVIRTLTQSKEQRARIAELMTKFRATETAILGEEAESMYQIASIATRPDRQGRGYAKALAHFALSMADAAGRRTYLASTNTGNRGFYASLGFQIAHTFEIGNENPSWQGKPVEIDLMVREVHQTGATK